MPITDRGQKFRHEWKIEITPSDRIALRERMRCVAKPDKHAENGTYRIRSLYFDSASDKALREKIDGVNLREKFRIRYYNEDKSVIHLEKKSKINGLCNKLSAPLREDEAQRIVDGRLDWMAADGRRCARRGSVRKPLSIIPASPSSMPRATSASRWIITSARA